MHEIDWNLVGHEAPVTHLRQLLERDRLPHALLLTGPPAIGKTALARTLATAILPEAPLSRHPDVWIDDEERALPIDSVRGGPGWNPDQERSQQSDPLQAFLGTRPLVSRRRVAIIARAQRMEPETANALLKTLEEPPPGALMILTTENQSMVLATVVSRCQVLRLEPVSARTIAAALQQRGVEAALAARLGGLSDGAPGLALELAADPDRIAAADAGLASLRRAASVGRLALMDLAEELGEAGPGDADDRRRHRENLLVITASWLAWARDAMALAVGADDLVADRDQVDQLRHDAGLRSPAAWAALVDRCVLMRAMIRRYVPPRLALEKFLLESFAASSVARPGDLAGVAR